MPALSSKFVPVLEVAPSAPAFSRFDDVAPTTGAPVKNAHAVVENVLAVVDAQANQAAGARSSVNLQFKVGGEDLAVRVELRGTEVHAQFRTESPELRAAIAQEWSAITSGPAEHNLRMLDPVFVQAPVTSTSSASGSDAFSSALGGDASRQQHAPQREQTFIPSAHASLGADNERAVESDAPVAARVQDSSRRLHTFA